MKCERTWTYLLKDRRTGFYKIGQSIDPAGRLRTLCKQATLQPEPNDYELIEAWWSGSDEEGRLHKIFADYRRRGEWFEFKESQVKEVHSYFGNRQKYSSLEVRSDVVPLLSEMWFEIRRLQRMYEQDMKRAKQSLDWLTEDNKKAVDEINLLSELLKERVESVPPVPSTGRLVGLPKISEIRIPPNG